MKTMRAVSVLFVSLAITASLSAQTITGYGITKAYNGIQTDGSTFEDDGSDPHTFSAFLSGTGLAGTYSVTLPGGGSTYNFDGSFNFPEQSFVSSAALNLVFPDGVYSMTLPNNGGAGPQTVNLPSLAGDLYPDAPLITGGTWSAGRLVINSPASFSLNFSSTVMSSDDSVNITIRDSGDNTVYNAFRNAFSADQNTFHVAGALVAGQIYSVNLQFNNNTIDYGTSIAGANGSASYSVINSFEIQAIPEPSTYAAIFGALALAGVVVHRRRRAV